MAYFFEKPDITALSLEIADRGWDINKVRLSSKIALLLSAFVR